MFLWCTLIDSCKLPLTVFLTNRHVENILPPVLSEILPLVPTEGVDSASLALFSVEWRSLWESAMALESESSVAALAMSPSSTLSVIPESRRGVRGGGANSESERSGNGERSTRSAEREEVASTNPSDRCASSPSRPGLSLLAGEEVAEEGTALQPNDYFLQSLMDSFDGFLSRSPAVIAMQTCIFSKVASVPHRCIGAFFCSQVEEAMGPLSYLEEVGGDVGKRMRLADSTCCFGCRFWIAPTSGLNETRRWFRILSCF